MRIRPLILALLLLFSWELPVSKAQEVTIQTSDRSYQAPGISIEITSGHAYRSDYFVADIRVEDLKCLRRSLAKERWGQDTKRLSTLAKEKNAIIALSGDYSVQFSKGHAVVNGKLVRKTENRKRPICVIYEDGVMDVISDCKESFEKAMERGVWQSFLFGPGLIEDGMPIQKTNSNVARANPRAAIGYFEPGHYCFVVVDGRQKGSVGMTLVELAKFMHELGCVQAYNLDGGQSASMWFQGKTVNHPYKSGRRVTDMVYITDQIE